MARGRGKRGSKSLKGSKQQEMWMYLGGALLLLVLLYFVMNDYKNQDEGYKKDKNKKASCPVNLNVQSSPTDVQIQYTSGLTKVNKQERCFMKCLAQAGYTCPPDFDQNRLVDANNVSSAWKYTT